MFGGGIDDVGVLNLEGGYFRRGEGLRVKG